MNYPKTMFHPDGSQVLCKQAVHEADLRAEGYSDAPANVVLGAPDDEPAAPVKRGRKAKA